MGRNIWHTMPWSSDNVCICYKASQNHKLTVVCSRFKRTAFASKFNVLPPGNGNSFELQEIFLQFPVFFWRAVALCHGFTFPVWETAILCCGPCQLQPVLTLYGNGRDFRAAQTNVNNSFDHHWFVWQISALASFRQKKKNVSLTHIEVLSAIKHSLAREHSEANYCQSSSFQ